MKNYKKLIAVALVPVLMPFSLYANEVLAAATSDETNSTVVVNKPTDSLADKANSLGNKLWESALKALSNAKIRKQVNTPTIELAKGLNIGGSYSFESSPSTIVGKYSGIDVWELNLAAYPELFGVKLPSGIGAGLSMGRQITYIQQFNTQKESLMRVPYDPITKLPLNAKIFSEKQKNIFTGQEEQVLKPGDFIGYRAPMTFSLGKGFSSIAASHFGLSASLSYVISGEFDVHVFVMNNNLVRVKILAAKSQTKGASIGINLLGFSGIGAMVINKLIDTNLLEFYFNASNSDLFIADYVFNMNKEEPKELYNRIVGSKLHIFSMEAIKQQILAANPFASDATTRERLIANLDDLNTMAIADLNKPTDERRMYKLLNAHNQTESITNGQKINLFKVLKFQNSESKTGSKITIYANDDDSVKAKFKLDGFGTTHSFDFIPWLNIWGDRHTSNNSLLTQMDLGSGSIPIDFVGLQNTVVREDTTLHLEEYNGLQNRMQKILPKSIYDKLEKPNWNFGPKKAVLGAHIQQDITFNSNLFKIKSNISEEEIKATLINILKHYGKMKSRPMASANVGGGGGEGIKDYAMEAFNKGNYVEAYEGWELSLIPRKLSIALNGAYSFSDRYQEFSDLFEKVPLFAEISNVLLLKLVPENELEKVVLVRFMMSAKNQTSIISDYPTTESFNTSNLFREILSQVNFINDRSYNLRNYLKEDGTQYTIDEILIEKK